MVIGRGRKRIRKRNSYLVCHHHDTGGAAHPHHLPKSAIKTKTWLSTEVLIVIAVREQQIAEDVQLWRVSYKAEWDRGKATQQGIHSRRDGLGHWSLRRNVASVLFIPRHPVCVDVVVLPVVRVWSNSDARVVVRHDVSIPVPRAMR